MMYKPTRILRFPREHFMRAVDEGPINCHAAKSSDTNEPFGLSVRSELSMLKITQGSWVRLEL